MNRKEFIHSCGVACVGTLALGLMFQGCRSTKMITAQLSGSDLLIPLSAFDTEGKEEHQPFVLAQNENLQYPIGIYRFDEQNYTALLMRCTHQGTELQAFGDRLLCPAHGSEFTNKGEVQSGPADQPLRTFPVVIEKEQLRISLK